MSSYAYNLERNAQADARKQQFSDEERKRQRDIYEAASHNIQKHVALLLNPDTMQPIAGKEAQVAQLRGEMNRINEYLTKFSNPEFNPQSGMVNEDPLHKLADKLHLTKAPAQNKTAGEQMKDLKGITEKYGQEPPLLSREDEVKATRIKEGLDPRATADKPPKYFGQMSETVDAQGKKHVYRVPQEEGAEAEEVKFPEGQQPVDKKAAGHVSKYDQQKAEFAKSLGKTSDQLTWEDEQKFLHQLDPTKDRRLAIAESMLGLAQKNYDLKEAEGNFHDFMTLQKSLSPLQKIQTASANANEYVQNPSGPGDIALVFSFIQATKPDSGFRFTDTEKRWIETGARSMAEGIEARINQGFTGQTLAPDQRAKMAGVIKHAGEQVKQVTNNLLGGAAQFKPKAAAAASEQVNPPTGRKHSLSKAMALPINKGKTEAEVIEDLKKHGYEVTRP